MTPEVIALFYAADMIGATLNLVDPRYSVEGIHEYIEEVDSHLLVCLNVVYVALPSGRKAQPTWKRSSSSLRPTLCPR